MVKNILMIIVGILFIYCIGTLAVDALSQKPSNCNINAENALWILDLTHQCPNNAVTVNQ